MPIWLKFILSALIITIVSEIAKRSDRFGALVGALPWLTVLVMVWLAVEKQGSEKIANHSYYTFWFVLPTLPMFLLIPWMLRRGVPFAPTLIAGIALTCVCFAATAWAAKGLGVELWPSGGADGSQAGDSGAGDGASG